MRADRKSEIYIPENLDFLNIQNLGERLNEEEIEGLLDEADLEGKVFIFTIFFILQNFLEIRFLFLRFQEKNKQFFMLKRRANQEQK